MKQNFRINNHIKRIICLGLAVSMVTAFAGCKKNPASADSSLSEEIEYRYIDAPSSEEQDNSEEINKTEENTSDKKYAPSNKSLAVSDNSSSVNTSTYSETHSDEEPTEIWVSTVVAPKEAFLYKNGKKYRLADNELNLLIAQKVEKWFAEMEGIMAFSLLVLPDLIWEIKSSETVIEFFYDDDDILKIGKNYVFSSNAILIPLTGEQNDMIFKGDGNGKYFSGPIYSPSNSSLNEIIDAINLETLDEVSYVSTITVPEQAFLYKDGIKYRLTNAEQILNMAKTVEKWFVYFENQKLKAEYKWEYSPKPCEEIDEIKSNETAVSIEFYYGDKEILMNGKNVFPEPTKGFFIPMNGLYEYYIFINKDENVYSEDYFSPIGGGLYELAKNADIEIIE